MRLDASSCFRSVTKEISRKTHAERNGLYLQLSVFLRILQSSQSLTMKFNYS